MTIRKQNRCPTCGTVVDLASMVYSSSSQMFVCPSCLRAGTRPPLDQPSVASAPAGTPSGTTTAGEMPTLGTPPLATPPPASSGDDVLSTLVPMGGAPQPSRDQQADGLASGAFASALPRPSATAPAVSSLPPPRKPLPSWVMPAGMLMAAALVITTLAILFIARAKPAVDARRVWEESHRDQIIALKSKAEELTIARKLPEAHAKYRELEQMVGGHTIGDPRLFDLVDQARLDQSRVYRMILNTIDPKAVDAGPLPSAVATTSPATAAPAVVVAPMPVPSAAKSTPPPSPAVRASAARPAAVVPAAATTAPAAHSTAPSTSPDTVAATAVPSATSDPSTDAARHEPRSYTSVTDAQVEQAIHRGVDFLIANFQGGRLNRPSASELERDGASALAIYALLQASRAIRHDQLGIKGEFLTRCIEELKRGNLQPDGSERPPSTYARSLRASALATYNRPEDRAVLQEDVTWLINAQVEGSYTYDDSFAPPLRRRPPQEQQPREPAGAQQPPPRDRSGAQGDAAAGDARSASVHKLDMAALLPPMILAHNGEVMAPPPPPPIPPPPPYLPDPYKRTPIYQLPRPGYRGSLKPPTNRAPWDNSNSQYGVLGVWAGAEVGIEVPDQYWKDVQQHWQRAQHASGQWSYTPEFEASFSMTCGGVSTLLITHDYLDAPLLGSKTAGRKPYDDFLTAGLAYLEHGDNVMDVMGTARDAIMMVSYNLFGLERVGLASGLKYIGVHDWYAELSAQAIPQQRADGSWAMARDRVDPDPIVDTAYMLLFLSRGRHPVMMNKLRFDGFWTNRPRDVANLATYATREMERPVNWQVVDIARPADDWADSPILYIASNDAPKLSADEVARIRKFVEDGGLLFTHADLGSDKFSAWAAKLAKDVFPGQALANVSPQHPIYSLNYKIDNPRPRLQAVDNGVRLLMIHSPTDLSNAWQVRATESRKMPFQLAVNLYLYATGKERFRNRLDTRAVPEPPSDPAPQIDIAQIQYDGNWNPEPGAWPRFVKSFQNNTGTRLIVHPVPAAELDTTKHIMAVMTGASSRTPTDADLAPTAKFVRDGGTLLVDACGGSGAFANAIEPWLAKLDPATTLAQMASDDVFLKASPDGAVDLKQEQLRLFTIQQLGPNGNRLKTMKLGKGRVIFTPLDYTSGLMGTNTWGILGYLPEYSESLATNVVLVTSRLAKN